MATTLEIEQLIQIDVVTGDGGGGGRVRGPSWIFVCHELTRRIAPGSNATEI